MFIERYSRRDGLRVGGVGRAELVTADTGETTASEHRQSQRIDALYRAWVRNRRDVGALQQLHAAITDELADAT